MSVTSEENSTIQLRTIRETLKGLSGGPAPAFGLGAAVVWAIGTAEAYMHVKPDKLGSSWRFCARYGLAQIIPSLIWGTQPATLIAELTHTPVTNLFHEKSLPCNRVLNVTRLTALRGAIAGSVLLSQVIAIMSVGFAAQTAYEER